MSGFTTSRDHARFGDFDVDDAYSPERIDVEVVVAWVRRRLGRWPRRVKVEAVTRELLAHLQREGGLR